MMKRIRLWCFFVLFVQTIPCLANVKQTIPDAAQLKIRLKKLTVVGAALYIGAHPDDENTAALAYLSLGKGVRTAYLSLTRGEGGQNLIGSEQGNLLGLIRTQELLAARRIDGAEQFFTRAVDFGFSKTPEETLQFWGKDAVLSDVVWIIRKFRPDIIITRFPNAGGGHGNHTASGILAEEAFSAAGDPARFPEQLKIVKPWKPVRIVWNRYSWTGPLSDAEKNESAKMEVGEYDPLLGKSYSEIAALARSMHKSQGFGDSEDRGKLTSYFKHTAGIPAKSDLFEGIDLSWKRIPGGEKTGALIQQAYESFQPENPAGSIPLLLQAYQTLNGLTQDPFVEEKREEIREVVRDCSGIWFEAISSVESVVPGTEIDVATTVINRSEIPFTLESIELLPSNILDSTSAPLENNTPVAKTFKVRIPRDAPYSQPYWLTQSNGRPLAIVENPRLIGQPETAPSVRIRFSLKVQGQVLKYEEPVFQRTVDPVRGEIYRELVVVPEVSLHFKEPVLVFPDEKEKPVTLEVTSNAQINAGELKLIMPDGWKVEPASQPVPAQSSGNISSYRFQVTPGKQAGMMRAEVHIDNHAYSHDFVHIEYPHIPSQFLFPDSQSKLIPVDLKIAGKEIGYVMGPGDQIPEALKQVGYRVTFLQDEDLASLPERGNRLDAILVGVRAYNSRTGLKKYNPALLDYVKNGGTLVVQYQTTQDLDQNGLGPYPFRVSRDRVSVEDAPVTILNPQHLLLNAPNKISGDDFNGWVQERGLNFPDQWDPKYETVIACNDPGEPSRTSGILFTRLGKGVYIYTTYSWFRELPAGVPGAFRIFVNLISAGKSNEN